MSNSPAKTAAALLTFTVLLSIRSGAHDVITTPITFSREVSRLLYTHCASCHRPDGRAFSLLTYRAARPWATAIKEEVLERRMPPWGAVKGFGDFRDDRGLTQEQIGLIAAWVEGGAPEGDPALLPKLPDLSESPVTVPAAAVEIPVDATLTLNKPIALIGVRPRTVPAKASVMATAIRPDGSVEPLLWLYQYDPRFPHPYHYRVPLRLPAGTRIEIAPAHGAALSLLTSPR